MADLKQRLRDIETLDPHDLWADIQRRSEQGTQEASYPRSSRLPVFAVSFAVLALVAVLLAALLPLGDKGKAPGGVGGTSDGRYQAPAGWSVVLPPGWHALPFETSQAGASAVGVQLSNLALPAPTMVPGFPIQTSGKVLPPDGVSLIIAIDRDSSDVQKPPKTPPTPPLDNFHWLMGSVLPGSPYAQSGWFQWNGQTYVTSGKVGPQATSKDIAALDAIIRSLRFGASSLPGPSSFTTGLGTVSDQLQRIAVDRAKADACAAGDGSFDVSGAAATTLGSWLTMSTQDAPVAAKGGYFVPASQGPVSPGQSVAMNSGSVVSKTLFTSNNDPVYAVFLTGSCPGGVPVGARVILNGAGIEVRLDAWQRVNQPDLSQPFGDQFDG